jgi:protein-disulfide isomerase
MAQTKPPQKNNDSSRAKPASTTIKKPNNASATPVSQKSRDIAKRRAKRKTRELGTLLILGAAVAVILAIITLLFLNSSGNNTSSSANKELLIRPDSPTRGPENASVTLVEFLDPECEACRASHPEVEQLLKQFEGRVRFVVRYYLGHSNSTLAVAATEAAGEQGKYWEMQALLFNRQREWGEQRTPQTEKFISYAQSLGLDIERFKVGLQNPAYTAKAQRDMDDAKALAIRGTPTFYVNGKQVYGLNKDALRGLIEEGLRG